MTELRLRAKEQGVEREHYAVVCPSCKTVQSRALLLKHGVSKEEVDNVFGFSCVGRFTAPLKSVGCTWTLGGLFKIHTLEVIDDEGRVHMYFELATPEQAQLLEMSVS